MSKARGFLSFFLLYNFSDSFIFMPPKELRWHIKIEPSVRPSVRLLQIVSQRYLINYWSKLMKLHRKIKHNEKVCRAHDLDSYAQGQGRNQVKDQILSQQ